MPSSASSAGTPVAWLSDPRAGLPGVSVAMWAVILAYLWQDYGYNMVIFIAALQGIPQELQEAALIDGATPGRPSRKITLPLIRPTMLFVCVMTMLSSFQVFDIIQVMTNGDPSNQTQVLMLDIYKNAFRYQNLGWAAAEVLRPVPDRDGRDHLPDARAAHGLGVLRWLPIPSP